MDTPNPETPVTPADSQGDARPESTLPSSPMTDPVDQETKDGVQVGPTGNGDNAHSTEDTEGMDTKAKALTHLLKTSGVCPTLSCEGDNCD